MNTNCILKRLRQIETKILRYFLFYSSESWNLYNYFYRFPIPTSQSYAGRGKSGMTGGILKLKNHGGSGFSLIEMLVVISIIGILSAVITGFVITSIMSNTKAEILKEVRQNGNYALSTIEGIVLNSRSVECSADNKTLTAIDKDGNPAIFICEDSGQISSNSASLIGGNVSVTACSFACTPDSPTLGKPTRVDVNFLIGQVGNINLRSSEKASLEFEGLIITKNY